MSQQPTQAEATQADLSQPVLCPECGYDNRGTTHNQCSECGALVDRAAAKITPLPWAERKRLGWVRAFFSTWWRMLWDKPSVKMALGAQHRVEDASLFRWLVAALLALGLAGSFLVVVLTNKSAWEATFVTRNQVGGLDSAFGLDASVPWQAGLLAGIKVPWSASYPPVSIALCLALFAIFMTRVPRQMQARRDDTSGRNARIMARYAVAPLWPLVFLPLLAWIFDRIQPRDEHVVLIVLGTMPLVFLTILGTCMCVATWTVRAKGSGSAIGRGVALLLYWLLGGFVILYLLPWGCGLLYLVFASLH